MEHAIGANKAQPALRVLAVLRKPGGEIVDHAANGRLLRLRAERYLGYKQAKYVMRLEAVDRYDHIAGGQGGFWEDQGYDRYGGI